MLLHIALEQIVAEFPAAYNKAEINRAIETIDGVVNAEPYVKVCKQTKEEVVSDIETAIISNYYKAIVRVQDSLSHQNNPRWGAVSDTIRICGIVLSYLSESTVCTTECAKPVEDSLEFWSHVLKLQIERMSKKEGE